MSISHAQQEQQPGLLESLGKLLQPKQGAPAESRNPAVAGKERRVALVIGNAAYPGAGALKNPVNDANDIAGKLKNLGFDVTVRTDMRYREMLRSLTDFGDKVQSGTEALFFYAGHGMQVRGKNYLLPIDAEIRNEASVSSEAVDVDQLLDKLSLARLSVVILDACRNNPFERRFRGSGQGLAQINAPTGTLIAYATAPGKVAADGDGRNGLYTAELLAAMDVPGIKIEDVFKRVRSNVVRRSNDAQTPWESSSLTGDFYFIFQGPAMVQVQQAPADPEAETWAAAQAANTVAGYQGYLDAYPKGRYAAAARIRLTELQKTTASTATTDRPAAAVPPAPTLAVPAKSDDPESDFWNEVKTSGAREYLDAYLKQYPKGKYVALAKIELKKLDDKEKAERTKQEAERKAELARQEADRKAAAEKERTRLAAERSSAERARQETAQLAKEVAEFTPGKVFKDCADCPEMVIIPAGSFEMGSSNGRSDEKPLHRVRIVKSFALGKTEVTQRQWRAVMGDSPSHFSGCGENCPVEQVSWNEAQEFVRKLSQKTGKTYRLPSEAEWEYACRAGGGHEYCGGDNVDSVAWYESNSGGKSHTVARKQANAWGLYDMSGNVWEWTEDCWNGNYTEAPNDGTSWTSGDCGRRVRRGGSWINLAPYAYPAKRNWFDSTLRYLDLGFRLAKMLP